MLCGPVLTPDGGVSPMFLDVPALRRGIGPLVEPFAVGPRDVS